MCVFFPETHFENICFFSPDKKNMFHVRYTREEMPKTRKPIGQLSSPKLPASLEDKRLKMHSVELFQHVCQTVQHSTTCISDILKC